MSGICCPKDSTKFLASTYTATGITISTPESFEYYVASPQEVSTKGIVLIPDVFGWNSGRVRNIADDLASQGYHSMVSKLLVPPLEGGVDGDGIPSNFDWSTRGPDFGAYMSQFDWPVLKPKVQAAVAHLQSQGVTTIGLIGFCWGGHVVAKALSDPDIYPSVVCGVSPHPSLTLEKMVFGRSTEELAAQIRRPMFFLPAGNDPDGYREGGAILEAVRANNPLHTKVVDEYPTMIHGWVSRGDETNPETLDRIQHALGEIYAYLRETLL